MVKITFTHIISRVFLLLSVSIMVIGCKSTKFIPDDRYLLSDIEINVDNRNIDKEELATYVRQKENLKILGFIKFHLWVYNLSSKNKEQGWLKRIGEPPVIYDVGLKNTTTQQLEQYLFNKGYYRAVVTDSIAFKNKKAKILYNIQSGDPYLIRNINYTIKDEQISSIIRNNLSESLLKAGDVFDVDQLQKERTRLAMVLKNEGFFRFADEFIHYKVDTTQAEMLVDIEMIVENANVAMEIVQEQHLKYYVRDFSIFIDNQRKAIDYGKSQIYTDTTYFEGFTFYHNGEIPLKSNLFIKAIEIAPGELYSKKREDRTYNNLYALKQFKYVNIQFHEIPNPNDTLTGLLHGRIFLPMQVKQNYSVDIEGTNTSSNLGIAGNLNYQHRNLLGGAEIFDVTFKGGTERQVAFIDNISKEFNTLEFGSLGRLTIPGFIFPIEPKRLNFFSTPFTSLSLSYNYQRRPDYTRTIVNTTYGYRWRSSAMYSHNFNLIDLNAVRIFSLNPAFIDQIKDLYIKSSYTDHIISASSYSLTFSNQGVANQTDYHFFRINIETAGNTLWGVSNVIGREKVLPDLTEPDKSSYYQYFNTRFAQYLKGDFDFRYGYRVNRYNSVATRAFAGVAYPYGNFNVMPFEKRYFTGGANGIRAWQVRSLGPGSYAAGPNEYPNQSADIKLEANIEYRFSLFWMFEGALFVDGGNIWAINQLDNREGAVFNFSDFYQEFALGTGFGLRLVSSYFIVRADVGLKLRDPSLPGGARWIPQSRSYQTSDLNFNIAIGYPF